MRQGLPSLSRVLSTSLLGLLLIPLPWSCGRKRSASPSPPPPPPPSYFEMGEKYFRNKDYASAVAAYETYLRQNPSGQKQDQALFRLALVHAYPESPVRSEAQARHLFQQLVARFPASPWAPQARLVLTLLDDAEKLRSEVSLREKRIEDLSGELARLKESDEHQLQEEVEKLRSEVSQRERRIRELSGELDRLSGELEQLKEIDMQRRPRRLPP